MTVLSCMKSEKKYYQRSFFAALIMAAVLFLPFVIIDGGYFVFYGDYNAQQIPFFKHSVEAVHNGALGWDWQTDLGANFIGSYSYYTLGSPFFWFMTLFPAAVSQYLMAPLLCVKIALFSLFSFAYIRRFVSKPQSALIGGILYAFSSFNLYNIFFQFQDAIIFFPLLLLGLEEFVINKRKGFFAAMVAVNCFANYFFFIGEVIFLVIYFVIRFLMDKRFRVGWREFLFLMGESLLGVMMACALFIPSVYQVLDVPRSTNILKNWSFLFYSNEQRYGLIIESMFFPPEISARNNLFTEANAKWSSVALYLPLFSMAGVIAFLKGAKKHWARVLIGVCVLFAFVPGLNAMFTMFNDNFYTRWFYMPELICCMATVYALEREEFDLQLGNRICAGVVGVMTVLSLLAPFTTKVKDTEGVEKEVLVPRFMAKLDPVVFVQIFIAALFIAALWYLGRVKKRYSGRIYRKTLMATVISCSMILGYYFIGYGRAIGPEVGRYDQVVSADIVINDPDFYRIEALNELNNFNMLNGHSSLKSFTSIIPGSTFGLYDALGIKRTVNSAPEYSNYAFRAFSRVKYILVPDDMDLTKRSDALEDLEIYQFMETQGKYDIYKTDLALPMGFAYDTYFPIEDVKGMSFADKLMVRSAFLTEEQIEKYGDIMKKDPTSFVYSHSQFLLDAKDKQEKGVIQFSATNEGFTAKSRYDSEKLVVFSVPWCRGWSAQIDGEPVEVDMINGGLCAVRVPAGLCEITFRYRTPGLTLGLILTFVGIALFCGYVFYFRIYKHENPADFVHTYPLESFSGVKAHYSYVDTLTRQITESETMNGEPEQLADAPAVNVTNTRPEKYDFTVNRPLTRLTEQDEAFRVMEELEKRRSESRENENENESEER